MSSFLWSALRFASQIARLRWGLFKKQGKRAMRRQWRKKQVRFEEAALFAAN